MAFDTATAYEPREQMHSAVMALFPNTRGVTTEFCERFMKKHRASVEQVVNAVSIVRDRDFDARDPQWKEVAEVLHSQRDSTQRKNDDVQHIRDAWTSHEWPATATDKPELPLAHHREILAAEGRGEARHDDVRNWHETECMVRVTVNSYASRNPDSANRMAALKFQVSACVGRLRGLRSFGSATNGRFNQMAELVIDWCERLDIPCDLQNRYGEAREEVGDDGEVTKLFG